MSARLEIAPGIFRRLPVEPPMSSACQALVAACSPGDASTLRFCASVDWRSEKLSGERLTLQFDLPNDAAKLCAASLIRMADVMAVNAAGAVIADIAAWIDSDGFLNVDALAVNE